MGVLKLPQDVEFDKSKSGARNEAQDLRLPFRGEVLFTFGFSSVPPRRVPDDWMTKYVSRVNNA